MRKTGEGLIHSDNHEPRSQERTAGPVHFFLDSGWSVGGTQGALVGGVQGQAIAYHDAETQISSLALQQSEVHPDYSVNGYVFFPQGDYKGVQVVLLNQETHQTDTILVPWGGAPGELRDQYADSTSAESKLSGQTSAQPILPGATVHHSFGLEAPPQPAISSPGVIFAKHQRDLEEGFERDQSADVAQAILFSQSIQLGVAQHGCAWLWLGWHQ